MKKQIKPIYRQEGNMPIKRAALDFDLVKLDHDLVHLNGPAAKKLTRKQRARIRWEFEQTRKRVKQNKYCLPHEVDMDDIPSNVSDYFFTTDDGSGFAGFVKDGSGDVIPLLLDINYKWRNGKMVIRV